MASTLRIHRDRAWWPHDLVRRPCCGLPAELKSSGRRSPEGRRSICFQLIMLLHMLFMLYSLSMLSMLAMVSIYIWRRFACWTVGPACEADKGPVS